MSIVGAPAVYSDTRVQCRNSDPTDAVNLRAALPTCLRNYVYGWEDDIDVDDVVDIKQAIGAGTFGVIFHVSNAVGSGSGRHRIIVKIVMIEDEAFAGTCHGRHPGIFPFMSDKTPMSLAAFKHEAQLSMDCGQRNIAPHVHTAKTCAINGCLFGYIVSDYVRWTLENYLIWFSTNESANEEAGRREIERLLGILEIKMASMVTHTNAYVSDMHVANIMVSNEGEPFMIDFGVTQPTDAAKPIVYVEKMLARLGEMKEYNRTQLCAHLLDMYLGRVQSGWDAAHPILIL